MSQYLARRLMAVIPVLLVVITVIFLMIHLIPGDPAAVMLGPNATADEVAKLRRQMGLDRPIYDQLFTFFARTLRGDLGDSYFLDRPVVQAVLERVEPTLLLTFYSLIVAVLIGVPAGVAAAVRPNGPLDRVLMGSALVGVCVPNFWIALILISFVAVQWHWLPAMGYAPLSAGLGKNLRYMVLPALTLGFNQSALIARITRACMLEILQTDFIRTARAKGLTERTVIQWHAFRNVLIPVVTVIGVTFAILIGGAIVTEVVFNIPGLGRLLISGILRRDYPVVQGAVLFITLTYVVINLLVDVTYAFIDPRVKYE
ncbi:MAG TPA: ABC transporter permease [Candidatus Methylomirabilis sp.]|nr:ABC transporter permease [Candidatus Methylomirabilis sp.]